MPQDEKLDVKKWLRELREARGYTQAELAEIVGVDTRTILNAEGPKGGLPQGLAMLRLLRALGVVSDAPAQEAEGLDARLQALEGQVAAGFEKTVRAVGRLANRIDRLELPAPPQSASGS